MAIWCDRRTALCRLGGGLLAAACGAQRPAKAQTPRPLPHVQKAIDEGLEALLARQTDEGYFELGQRGRNVAVVGLAGLALMSTGALPGRGPRGEAVERIVGYLATHSRPSGLITETSAASHGPMYGHGFAALMMAEAYGMATQREDLRSRLDAAVELIVRSQNPAGGWRYLPVPVDADLSVTVCQVMALRAARNAGIYVPAETIDRAVDYVRRCQNPDGGFMYQLTGGSSRYPLTAAAIVALHSAGRYEGDELDRAYAFLARHRAGMLAPTRDNYFYYAHYYSMQAYWQRGGEAWEEWYEQVSSSLVRFQGGDGLWSDYNGRAYATAMATLILSVPQSVLPIFQR